MISVSAGGGPGCHTRHPALGPRNSMACEVFVADINMVWALLEVWKEKHSPDSVLVPCCHVTGDPHILQFKTSSIYYRTVSVCQIFGDSLAGSSGS